MSDVTMKEADRPADVRRALQKILEALDPIPPDERGRLLDSAATFYGATSPTGGGKGSTEKVADANAAGGRPLSIREFMQQARPTTNAQRIATFAHYREHYQGFQKFARADLLPYFGDAKEPEPGNYDRDFSAAVKEGWIHENGAASYITSSGVAAVTAGFGGKAKPRGATVKKRKRATA